MKETYWGYWLIVLGIFVVVIMLLIQNVTSNNTFDEYTIKQISEAAMVDAVDYNYYRNYGEIKINKEKFMENFLRRFAEVASVTTDYEITFTGIYEAPPKVSVEINSSTGSYVVGTSSEKFDMATRIDAILEQNPGATVVEPGGKVPIIGEDGNSPIDDIDPFKPQNEES